jgi:acetyl esterase
MPLDPQAKEFLDAAAAAGLPPTETLPPPEARARQEAQYRKPGPDVARVEDRTIPGPSGDIPVRIYTPEGDSPFPVLVWLHGGGWVLGSVNTNDPICRSLTKETPCIVVSVDYRLAPETKFPGGLDDCYAATVWCKDNAASLGGDPSRVALGGASAGANLTAAVTMMARNNAGPEIAHQLLVYPATDTAMDTPSYAENGVGYALTRSVMVWYYDHYVRDDADRTNPLVAPLLAEDLAGLPPATVITAEFDPLRDEGEAYAQRLTEAGVPTTCTRYDGMIHLFFSPSVGFDKSTQAIAQAATALRRAFGMA